MKKYIIIIGSVIIFFITLYYTGVILQIIRNKIVKSTNYALKIEKIEGNLFTNIRLKEVQYRNVFSSPYISISYTPLSIFRKKIKEVFIKEPKIEIQKTDSIITLPFIVDSLILQNGKIYGIPNIAIIDSLNILAKIEKTLFKIIKGETKFVLAQREIKLNNFYGSIKVDKKSIILNDFYIRTLDTKIKLEGEKIADSLNFNINVAKLNINKINNNLLGEVSSSFVILRNKNLFKIDGSFNLINAKYKDEFIGNVAGNFNMLNKELKLNIENWEIQNTKINGDGKIDLSNYPFSYEFILNTEKLNLTRWMKKITSDLFGKIKIKGKGKRFNTDFQLSGKVRDINIDYIEGEIDIFYNILKIHYIRGIKSGGELYISGDIIKNELNLSINGKNIETAIFLPNLYGKGNFDFIISGKINNPYISGSFYINDFITKNINSEYVVGNVNLTKILPPQGEGTISFNSVDLYKNKFENIKATLSTTNGNITFEVKGEGKLTFIGIKGESKENDFIIQNLAFSSPILRIVNNKSIKFKILKDIISIEPTELLVNNYVIQTEGLFSKDKISLLLTGKNFDLHTLSDSLYGNISFISHIKGPIIKPKIFTEAKINNFLYKTLKIEELSLSCVYSDGLLTIKEGKLKEKYGSAEIYGDIPLNYSSSPIDLNIKLVNFGADIFVLSHTLPEIKDKYLDGEITIKGNIKEPKIYGSIEFVGNKISTGNFTYPIEMAEANINFDADTIIIQSFEGITQKGKIEVNGFIILNDKINLNIKTKNLTINPIEDVKANITSHINITEKIKNPKISGEIDVNEAIVSMGFNRPPKINIQSPVDYDLTINLPGKVWIRNPEIDAELEGKVIIRKEERNLFISGKVNVKDGYYYYLERPFKIEKGEIEFTNAPELNPRVNLISSTKVNYTTTIDTITKEEVISCTLKVTGTIKEPQFNLFSQPPMPLEDIVSILSLNMKASELFTLQQKNDYPQAIGLKVASYYILRKSGFLEDIKTQIGVDALRIEPELLSEKDRSAKINVGKYVRKDLYISYTNDLFSPAEYEIKTEYHPWKYTSFIGERTKDGILKAGIQLKFKY